MYRKMIEQVLAQLGETADPRHVEAYIRVEHPTLDHLSAERFRSEVRIALSCIEMEGEAGAETLARSFGL